MTCSSGCCGPSKDEDLADTTSLQPGNDGDGDSGDNSNDVCCSDASCAREETPTQAVTSATGEFGVNDVAPAKLDTCCGIKPVMQEDCCAPSTKSKTSDKDDDSLQAPKKPSKGCCGPRNNIVEGNECCQPLESTPTPAIDKCCASAGYMAHDKDCCSSKSYPLDRKCSFSTISTQTKRPACCEGKPSPCCDSTCIDRLVLRECKDGKSAAGSDKSSGCDRAQAGKPCDYHSRTTREYYQSRLEALGCICRALLARGQESCCVPKGRRSMERNRASDMTSLSRASFDSRCTEKSKAASTNNFRLASFKEADDRSRGCCSGPRCDNENNPSAQKKPIRELKSNDLERGIMEKEHVVLSVSGMTCTGCETKLTRTLASLDGVGNLKTSLILARAEFDLDMNTGSVAAVIKHLERTTEFKCGIVTNQGSSLDLICSTNPIDFVNGPLPVGVIEARLVDKKTIQVDYDAKIVGARELIERGWNTPMQLAPQRPDSTLETGGRHVRHVGYMTLLSVVLTIPVLVMAWAPLPETDVAYGSASLALATIVQVVVAGPFYPKALKSLVFSRMVEMDLLIVLSTSAAYIFSVVSFGYLVTGHPLSTGEFFETSTLLVTLIMVGRYVAALARQKAVESISVRSLQSSSATIVNESGVEEVIDARLLQYGDVFKVVPDSTLPTDGTVISGSSEVNESMITGESKAIEKQTGSAVIAGSVNGSGTLTVRLTRLPGDNTISVIAGLVDEAKLSKPKIQELADRVATFFVPVVVVLTLITFVVWIAVGITVRSQSGTEATIQAITYAITVLIVSCPCAIGLAVPMVVVIATGVAAERGVIFKSAGSIEVAYRTTHVVFDKTGTLTQGKLAVVREEYIDSDPAVAKSLLLGLIGDNKHPVSSAIAVHLKANNVLAPPSVDVKVLTGKGVEGTVSGKTVRAGNSRWLGLSDHPQVQPILSTGLTVFSLTVDGSLAAVFGLEDSLRPDAIYTLAKLQESGIVVHVLSGDDDGAVQVVASQLRIPQANVRSRCTPSDKRNYIENLISDTSSPTKRKMPVVMFCGDGTNDAVALAQATIGVHMNEGTDVAKSAADVVLMRPSLAGILTVIAVSRKSIHRIVFNFGWSFVYNLFAILLGSGAFVNARIPPQYAGLGELASVLPVIAAAVMLRWAKV